MDEFEKLLSDRTKLVSVAHVSNVLGTVLPIRKIVDLAHARGIPVLVDGAQAAPHTRVDVKELGCGLLRDFGAQAFWADGHRRALRECGSARKNAAVSGRGRHDPLGYV